jgi:hypothetical protein
MRSEGSEQCRWNQWNDGGWKRVRFLEKQSAVHSTFKDVIKRPTVWCYHLLVEITQARVPLTGHKDDCPEQKFTFLD